ncbi:hypothetical protein EII12_01635 [Buchananella hordeovulneris]|uniref:hypothetical protein n=1 Tax=Buchananella hordeovulneris TaxID=52770 RepID=UPI000F5FF216|nr:hypothetical protein [Buchananella hordeovulneris]RRD53524.1 hypothetical protein EII12_01635 [Buchananella hordeovulneris]
MADVVRADGFDWVIVPSAQEGEVVMGVSIAYGLLDESVESHNTLRFLAEQLKIALRDPKLRPAGGLAPTVNVGAFAARFDIRIAGFPESVETSWRRLKELFADPVGLPTGVDYLRLSHPWRDDIAVRMGQSTLASAGLAGWVADAPARAAELLRYLDPHAGNRRAVFYASDRALVDGELDAELTFDDFAAAVGSLHVDSAETTSTVATQSVTSPVAVEWQVAPLLPGASGPATVATPMRYVLFSVVGPATLATYCAAQIMLDQIKVLAKAIAPKFDFELTTILLGKALLVTFELKRDSLEPAVQRRLLRTFLRHTEQVPAELFAAAAQQGQAVLTANRTINRLLFDLPDEESVSEQQVRAAFYELLGTVHLAESSAYLQEHGPLEGYPLVNAEPQVEQGRVFTSWIPAEQDPGYYSAASEVVVNDQALLVRYRVRRTGLLETRSVDLQRLHAALPLRDHQIMLVDKDARFVVLEPRLYRQGDELRQLLAAATAGVPRWTGSPPITWEIDPWPLAQAEQERIRRARRRRWLVLVALLVLAIGVWWALSLTGQSEAATHLAESLLGWELPGGPATG